MMVLLNIAEGTSRVHASRRVFEQLHRQQNDIPVIHHRVFPAGAHSPMLVGVHPAPKKLQILPVPCGVSPADDHGTLACTASLLFMLTSVIMGIADLTPFNSNAEPSGLYSLYLLQCKDLSKPSSKSPCSNKNQQKLCPLPTGVSSPGCPHALQCFHNWTNYSSFQQPTSHIGALGHDASRCRQGLFGPAAAECSLPACTPESAVNLRRTPNQSASSTNLVWALFGEETGWNQLAMMTWTKFGHCEYSRPTDQFVLGLQGRSETSWPSQLGQRWVRCWWTGWEMAPSSNAPGRTSSTCAS